MAALSHTLAQILSRVPTAHHFLDRSRPFMMALKRPCLYRGGHRGREAEARSPCLARETLWGASGPHCHPDLQHKPCHVRARSPLRTLHKCREGAGRSRSASSDHRAGRPAQGSGFT